MSDPSVLVAGEALVDLFPNTDGPLSEVDTFRRRAGGAPANVAVGLARLDRAPHLWTRLGDDPFGTHLQDVLDTEGVHDEFRFVDPVRKTAHTLVGDDPTADQSFTFFKADSATMAMSPGTVPESALESIDWVHIGGVLLCEKQGRDAMIDLATRAQAADCVVSFDPNTRLDLWPDEPTLQSATTQMLELTDVLKTDRDDLSFLVDSNAPYADIADTLIEAGPHTVCLTRGSDGTFARASESAPWGAATVEHSGFVVDVVETTGAGDAFTAGLISALQEPDRSLSDAVRVANAVGSLATTDTGAMSALPTREEVDTLLADEF